MILFADTSALLKLYIEEPGSERMQTIVAASEEVAASLLTYGEIYATLARRRREASLSAAQHAVATAEFERDWREMVQVPLGPETLAEIPALCSRYPLRGGDALQLASALRFTRNRLPLVFACSDQQLLEAAAGEALETFDPTSAR